MWVSRVLCVVAVIGVAEATRRIIGNGDKDLILVLAPSKAVASGHFSRAYAITRGSGVPSFQAPGFPLFAGGVMYLLSQFGVSAHSGIDVATGATAAAVVAGGVMILQALNISRRWEMAFLIGLAVDPIFAQTLWVYYHPQDVLALGLVLMGLAAGLRFRWGSAGLCLGVAFACKQTAVLGLFPLIVMAPSRQRIRVLAVAAVAAVSTFAPLCITNWTSVRQIIEGPGTVAQRGAFIDQLPISAGTAHLIARAGPVVAVSAISAMLWMVNRRRPVAAVNIVAIVMACLSLRPILEIEPVAYYLFPASVGLLLLAVSRQSLVPTLLWLASAGLWFDTKLAWHYSAWPTAVVYLLFGLSAVAICLTHLGTAELGGTGTSALPPALGPGACMESLR